MRKDGNHIRISEKGKAEVKRKESGTKLKTIKEK